MPDLDFIPLLFSASLSFSQDEVNSVDNPDQRYPGSQATITGSQRPGVWRLQPPPGPG